MRKRGTVLALAGLVMLSEAAPAQNRWVDGRIRDRSAHGMMPGCRFFNDTSNKVPDAVMASEMGRCIGTIDTMWQMGKSTVTCPPQDMTLGQIVRAVIRQVESQPARHHEDFYQLALQGHENRVALQAIAACRGRKRSSP
ncbi:MAG: hypothetical protein K2Z80_30075 [Xanthobacteraceae bacterium]|nr:hypothetical protein [Xanthobacteraceae bacterium]